MIWGCPALRAGRAMRGLAVRSAHRFFAALKSSVWPAATPYYPSACGRFAPCRAV
ncbi:hypothetical protein SGRA_1577 [Saprospira grandis str. Lewin]|uniref:Uncharacterized protein n=1 Tax=Saprospira grandis (strain Lewin) TaxID=984262 RepID=H6L9U9_SAPGL|nr:hypothetical protein SGRA_1577 [Saprospira grandis str. Lewin]